MACGMMKLALASLVALASLSAAEALYSTKGGPVQLLTHRSFSKVLSSKVPVVVVRANLTRCAHAMQEFFAPWCGHCKALTPAFTQAAERLAGIVPFIAVDCDAEANRALCGQHGVQGFPTIKVYRPKAGLTDYPGERTAKALINAATGLLTGKHITRLAKAADALAFLGGPGGKVLLVTDKPRSTSLFKSISQRFSDQLSFAEVALSSVPESLREQYGVSKAPTLLFIADGSHTAYDGELKAQSIIDWIKQQAGLGKSAGNSSGGGGSSSKPGGKGDARPQKGGQQETQQEKKREEQGEEKEEKGQQPPATPSILQNVTAGQLAAELEKEGVVVLTFFAEAPSSSSGAGGGGDGASAEDSGAAAAVGCGALLQAVNKAVFELAQLAKGIQVNLTDPTEAAAASKQFGVDLAPRPGESCYLRAYLLPFDAEDHPDTDEWLALDADGLLLDPKALHKAALQLFPTTYLAPVSHQTQRQWVLEGPSRLKVLLVTKAEEPPPLFRALSSNFRHYKIDFGVAHASDEQLVAGLGVKKVPSILLMFTPPKGARAQGEGKEPELHIEPYRGPLRYPEISMFLLMAAAQLGATPEGSGELQAEVPQLTDQAALQASCLDAGGLCILAGLPADAAEAAAGGDGEGKATPLAVLSALAAKRAGEPLAFGWVDAAAQPRFAAALGLGSPPTLAALAPRKRRYATFTGRFEEDAVGEWLDGLLAGRVRTSELGELPELGAGGMGEAAGEQGQVEEVLEDEFDLADILAEEVEVPQAAGARKDEL